MPVFPVKSCLIPFQDVDGTDFLPIHSLDHPFVLTFPQCYLRFQAILSLILASHDVPHNVLRMILDNPISNSYRYLPNNAISFHIISQKIELDFVSLQVAEGNNASEYDANTAKLKIEVVNSPEIERNYSKIIRNSNYDGSKEISVLIHGKSQTNPMEHVVVLERPIFYFPEELEIKFLGSNEKCIPYFKDQFPVRVLFIQLPLNSDPEIHNDKISIRCPKFNKTWKEQPEDKKVCKQTHIKKTSSIENRKNKDLDELFQIQEISTESHQGPSFNESSQDSNVPFLIQETNCKGICIIISNTQFEKRISREFGNKADENGIKNLFKELSYDVKVLENMPTKDLKECLEEIIKKEINETHENVIIFVLSHGSVGLFYTIDGEITFDELIQMFLPDINIPKLFFFNSCQEDKNQGKRLAYSNVFVGYSAIPGHISVRHETGTPYIQTLLQKIEKKHNSRTVSDIHQSVQNSISKNASGGYVRMSGCRNNLTQNTSF